MGYHKTSGGQQYTRKRVSTVPIKSFGETFCEEVYGSKARRKEILSDLDYRLRNMGERKLTEIYEKVFGKAPEEKIPEYGIIMSDDHVTALAPFGTLTKRSKNPDGEKVRKLFVKLLRNGKKKVKAESIESYKKRAIGEKPLQEVKIGGSSYSVERLVDALKILSRKDETSKIQNVYVYTPKQNSILILENENEDRIFIAPHPRGA
jgi:hypothetical protein